MLSLPARWTPLLISLKHVLNHVIPLLENFKGAPLCTKSILHAQIFKLPLLFYVLFQLGVHLQFLPQFVQPYLCCCSCCCTQATWFERWFHLLLALCFCFCIYNMRIMVAPTSYSVVMITWGNVHKALRGAPVQSRYSLNVRDCYYHHPLPELFQIHLFGKVFFNHPTHVIFSSFCTLLNSIWYVMRCFRIVCALTLA